MLVPDEPLDGDVVPCSVIHEAQTKGEKGRQDPAWQRGKDGIDGYALDCRGQCLGQLALRYLAVISSHPGGRGRPVERQRRLVERYSCEARRDQRGAEDDERS